MNYTLSAFADEAAASLSAQMDACERNGFKQIEMRFVDGRNTVDHTPDECREIRCQLDARGFTLSALGSPFGKINIKDDFAAHMEKFKRGMELCHILGATRIRMFSFYLPEEDDPALYRGQVMEQLGVMVEAARAEDLLCCHENEKGIYGDTAERCWDIVQTLPGLPLVFDPANFIQCGEDVAAAYDLLQESIAYLHIKDAKRADGGVVPAGEGDGALPYVLSRYLARPGEHLMTLEPHLMAFPGFSELEKENESIRESTLQGTNAAFDKACNALKKLL